jgi:PilZ domain
MNERRKEPRYLVREDAAAWDLHYMKAGCRSATIVDISRNGICVESSEKLTQGNYIAIDFRGMIICGTVQHCRRTEGKFITGVRIREVLDPLRESPLDYCVTQEVHAGAEAVMG